MSSNRVIEAKVYHTTAQTQALQRCPEDNLAHNSRVFKLNVPKSKCGRKWEQLVMINQPDIVVVDKFLMKSVMYRSQTKEASKKRSGGPRGGAVVRAADQVLMLHALCSSCRFNSQPGPFAACLPSLSPPSSSCPANSNTGH